MMLYKETIDEEMVPFPAGKPDDAIDVMSRIYDMNVIWPSATSGINKNKGESSKISPW